LPLTNSILMVASFAAAAQHADNVA